MRVGVTVNDGVGVDVETGAQGSYVIRTWSISTFIDGFGTPPVAFRKILDRSRFVSFQGSPSVATYVKVCHTLILGGVMITGPGLAIPVSVLPVLLKSSSRAIAKLWAW